MSEYIQSMIDEFEQLALDKSNDSIVKLKGLLLNRDSGTYEKHIVPYLACRALIYKGSIGINIIREALPDAPGHIYPLAILSSLFYAQEGTHAPHMFETKEHSLVLNSDISEASRAEIKKVFLGFLDDCRSDPESFHRLISLLYFGQIASAREETENRKFHQVLFNLISDSTLRVSDRNLDELDNLINSGVREEEFQKFFTNNPIFLNPLASKLISKQKLGDEFITDYVLETLTGEYVAIEIEKPTDPIFTKSDNFSYQFTHAFGQVLDFIDWIEQNIAYAQRKLPGICAPKGLLVIGNRSSLTSKQAEKLRRFNSNSKSIEVVTFDDLLFKARTLQSNIQHRIGFD
ncbi:Shedu anti-phage system protein SduA domain-containing protein [Vibrio harveyi]|uniref:Shedu anti-phage system protein SduA domain-containing protein n=3 Tax=Vibrio harveyi TaxID=669 RepID=UPI0006834A9E|nr:Shedu anti-phage system protein SduA domain-containing protein [Vibrio harveyi]